MILENLKIIEKQAGNFFYFAADSKYFDAYGKALALSLLKHAPWAKVHVHLYNPSPDQRIWCDQRKISFTEDIIDESNPEFRTLCACIRFIRISEIFDQSARVISFDCDVIANNTIDKDIFFEDTETSSITIRKGGKSLASAISFGLDTFRDEFRKRLLNHFEKDEIYWFLDQDVLDAMMRESPLRQLNPAWTSTKMTPDRMIWTAKGDRKNANVQYVNLLKYYNTLS
jgi:hypothetical protein